MLSKITEVWFDGGAVMIPLFLLGALLYTVGFQLLFYVMRGNLSTRDEYKWRDWVRDPENAPGRVGEIIRYTQHDTTSAKDVRYRYDEIRSHIFLVIDRRLFFLNTLVAAAPLMGLLGTVMGMLMTFVGISQGAGSETVGMVSSGISAALLTTQTGLMLALPGLFIAMLVRHQKHRLEASLGRLEALTLGRLDYRDEDTDGEAAAATAAAT